MEKTYIIIHHSATADGNVKDFDQIKKEHLARGYRDIGYHYVVEKVNNAYQILKGRDENEDAAACPGRNQDGIHICLVGNFEETIPSLEQFQILAGLCRDIMTRHKIQRIGGHKDYYATACPGKNFDLLKLCELVKEDNMTAPEAIDYLKGLGIISDTFYWNQVLNVTKNFDVFVVRVAEKLAGK